MTTSRLHIGLAMLVGCATLMTLQTIPLALAQSSPTTRISFASNGAQANQRSEMPSLSADGRLVAFASDASNLVAGDTNNATDIFVYDRQTGQTTRVSIASNANQADNFSVFPVISANGQVVSFVSSASNLVADDWNNKPDVFVYDRATGQTSLVSVSTDGTESGAAQEYHSLSADGQIVAFSSDLSSLVPGDLNDRRDIFVQDRTTGETTRVSVGSNGAEANDRSELPTLSADGRLVAFASLASNLTTGDTNNIWDIFVHDRQTSQTSRVLLTPDGSQVNGSVGFFDMSADGRLIAFMSSATNMVPGDTNGADDVFVHDRQTGETRRVSVGFNGAQANGASFEPRISGDGQVVSFGSWASNLVAGDTNGKVDVFVHVRATGQTSRVSLAANGAQANDTSFEQALSGNGQLVAFRSSASNLVAGDTNGVDDIFVHNRAVAMPTATPTHTASPTRTAMPTTTPSPMPTVALNPSATPVRLFLPFVGR